MWVGTKMNMDWDKTLSVVWDKNECGVGQNSGLG